jgi:hypothetical protein
LDPLALRARRVKAVEIGELIALFFRLRLATLFVSLCYLLVARISPVFAGIAHYFLAFFA